MLPFDVILGVPSTSAPQSPLNCTCDAVEKLQLAYDLARRNFKEWVDKQAVANDIVVSHLRFS